MARARVDERLYRPVSRDQAWQTARGFDTQPVLSVYAVAAVTVGAEPVFVPATRETGFLPDYAGLPADVLDRTAIAYICSPSNPQGAIASRDYLRDLIALAEKHDFKVFADECYSEIYRREKPVGALQVAREMGADPERVVIFHSLSKRSNMPGLRSGFVASGPKNIHHIKQLRAYSGGAAAVAGSGGLGTGVGRRGTCRRLTRALRREIQYRGRGIRRHRGVRGSRCGIFFLWLPVADGEEAAIKLWTRTGIRVLPGAYLSRDANGQNPGAGYIRVALVAPKEETQRGLITLRDCLYG